MLIDSLCSHHECVSGGRFLYVIWEGGFYWFLRGISLPGGVVLERLFFSFLSFGVFSSSPSFVDSLLALLLLFFLSRFFNPWPGAAFATEARESTETWQATNSPCALLESLDQIRCLLRGKDDCP